MESLSCSGRAAGRNWGIQSGFSYSNREQMKHMHQLRSLWWSQKVVPGIWRCSSGGRKQTWFKWKGEVKENAQAVDIKKGSDKELVNVPNSWIPQTFRLDSAQLMLSFCRKDVIQFFVIKAVDECFFSTVVENKTKKNRGAVRKRSSQTSWVENKDL